MLMCVKKIINFLIMSVENCSYLIITCKPKPSQPSTTGNVNVCQGLSLCCVGGDV